MTMMSLSTTAVRSRRLPGWIELKSLIVEWHQRARSRYELTMLNDRDLSDMGLTPMDALDECDKPFWRP